MSRAVFIVGQIQVSDFETYFSEYALQLNELLKKYDGEALAGTTKAEVLEGEGFGNWTVIIKFPNRELANACLSSEEYKPLSIRRQELSEGGNIMLVPGKM